jgi:hypothetical protein
MDRSTMSSRENAAWNACKSMACAMDLSDLRKEIKTAQDRNDEFRVRCFQALLAEAIEENAE